MYIKNDKSHLSLFVASNGNKNNSGMSIDKPLASMEEARNKIRLLRKSEKNLDEAVTVYLRKGTYNLKNTFTLKNKDSGNHQAPIIYRPHANENVYITGGKKLDTSKFKKVIDPEILERLPEKSRDKVLQINLKEQGINDLGKMSSRGFRRPYVPAHLELFFNDQVMSLARWPNDVAVPIGEVLDKGSIPRKDDLSNRGGKFKYNFDRPQQWEKADDIWLSGLFNRGYADDILKVENINIENKTIKLSQPHMYGIDSGEPWQKYYAFNLLEEIDKPGEYYLDRDQGILYFWPPEPIAESKVSVSLLEEPMIVMEGVSNVIFKNITFEVTRGMGIYIERGNNNKIIDCTLRNMGIVGVCIGRGIKPNDKYCHNFTGEPVSRKLGSWHEHIYDNPAFDRKAGTNHGIIGCHIYNIGAGGVSLGGGDRKTLTPAHNYVSNCHIHNFNRLDKSYKAAVNIDGVGNKVSHCHIHEAPNSGIYLHGNNHIIEYNEINDVCLESHDMGAFYMGRDPSERGNIIRNNYFHHIGNDYGMTMAVYLDDGACGTQIYKNIFFKAGSKTIVIGGGQDNPVFNNIFIDSELAIHLDNRLDNRLQNWVKGNGFFKERLEIFNYDQSPYKDQYPELTTYWKDKPNIPKRNHIKNNIFNKVKEIHNCKPEWGPVQENFLTDKDLEFINIEYRTFNLNYDSNVYEKLNKFNRIPFIRIGI